MGRGKAFRHRRRLGGGQGADGVRQRPTRRHQGCCGVEQAGLEQGEASRGRSVDAPPGVRAAPQRAQARTGGVDEHPVERRVGEGRAEAVGNDRLELVRLEPNPASVACDETNPLHPEIGGDDPRIPYLYGSKALEPGRPISDPADPTVGVRTQLLTIKVERTIKGDPVDTVVVETDRVHELRATIAGVARDADARLWEVVPLDDDLDSVFRYLVGR